MIQEACSAPRRALPRLGVVALAAVLACGIAGTPARAAVVRGLFRVELAAGRAPPADPDPLFVQAARVVLRRLGLRLGVENKAPAVSAILGDPRHWIAEYGYTEGGASGPFRIWVRFDARNLMRTLLAGGIAVWGRERPRVLCALAVPTSSGRRLLGAGSLASLNRSFEREARRRGLPVLLPVDDLADLQLLAPGVLETTPLATLAPALKRRYPFDALLVGHLDNLGSGSWRGRFRLWSAGGVRARWTSRPQTTRRAVLHHLVRRLAGVFALREALLPGDVARPVVVRVDGLERLSAVVSVGRLLGRILGVRRLALVEIRGRGVAVWRFETRIRPARLERILLLTNRLVPRPSTPGVVAGRAEPMRFRYRS